MNAGKETIGAVSLGRRDPAIAFTSDQVNLLQAIADLVAGAIVRARLLEESQLRARQLASLNAVTHGLTSTLELDLLLDRILAGALSLLDCEAGSLLLLDEHTGELVFSAITGPVMADLLGKCLPPEDSLAWKSVKSRQGMVLNELPGSQEWFHTGAESGFAARDLIQVPMQVKDQVIGILQVLNKRDRSPPLGPHRLWLRSSHGDVVPCSRSTRRRRTLHTP